MAETDKEVAVFVIQEKGRVVKQILNPPLIHSALARARSLMEVNQAHKEVVQF